MTGSVDRFGLVRPCYVCLSESVSEFVPGVVKHAVLAGFYHLCCQCADAYLCVSVCVAKTAVVPWVYDSSCYLSAVERFHDMSMGACLHTVRSFFATVHDLANTKYETPLRLVDPSLHTCCSAVARGV